MARSKKPDLTDAGPKGNARDILRLLFQGELLEVALTDEYPIQVLQTKEYETWVESLSDLKTGTRININVDKMQRGLFGDWKVVGDGVFELRLDFGAGYRIYYAKYEAFIIILLGGGDKSDQRKNIANAKRLWKGLKNEITQV